MKNSILGQVTFAVEALSRVQSEMRRQLGGRSLMSPESVYKHIVAAQEAIEDARVEQAKLMVRQPQEVAD